MISFSIITVTYNAASVVQPTLDSVLSQDYPHVEHIIVDGASADGTIEKVENYRRVSDAEQNGHTIVVLSKPDKGLYDAMNKGLRLATGTYLLYLNAGDRLAASNTLSRVAEAAEGGDGEPLPVVIYGDTDIVDIDDHFLSHRHLSVPEVLSWRSFQRGMLVCHQAFYALREIARHQPYDYRYRLSADVDWCIRVMREGDRQGRQTRNVHAVVCHYLEGGLSIQNHRTSLKERFQIMRSHYGLFSTLMWHCWFIIRQLIKKGRPS